MLDVKPDPLGGAGTIVSFILRLFGIGKVDVSGLEAGINTTWANLYNTSQFLHTALGILTGFVGKLFKTLFGGITHIISDVLHGHLNKALQDLEALLHNIHNLFAPLLDYLHRLQRLQRQRQMAAMKNVLNLIQRVRKILVPLRILHVKFAQKLDAWLAGIEGRIITREHAIVSKTNEIVSWIDLITNAGGGLHGWAVAGGLGRMDAALRDALLAAGVENVFPFLRRVYRDPILARPFSDWQAPFFADAENSPSNKAEFKAGVLEVYRRAKEEMQT
jgi:hypothetical protein